MNWISNLPISPKNMLPSQGLKTHEISKQKSHFQQTNCNLGIDEWNEKKNIYASPKLPSVGSSYLLTVSYDTNYNNYKL